MTNNLADRCEAASGADQPLLHPMYYPWASAKPCGHHPMYYPNASALRAKENQNDK